MRAKRRGLTIRQLASLTPAQSGWQAQVRNVLLPRKHPLASIGASEAALLYRGDAVGEVFIRGGGAGGRVTASAVLGDLFNYVAGYPGHIPLPEAEAAPQHSPEQWEEI
jgi:homoserine dehydrogenase